EARSELGGMLVPGSRPAIKKDVANYLDYLRTEVAKAMAEHGLKVELNTAPTPAHLRAAGYDGIVTATGSKQARPPVPGIDSRNVVTAVDLLRNPEIANGAKSLVIVGGGVVGCETAYFLSHELEKRVAIIEMLPVIMKGVCTANRGWLIHYLEERGVPLYNCTRLASVGDGEVTVMRNMSRTVPDPMITWSPLLPENVKNPFAPKLRFEEKEERLPADLVVLAAGARPDDSVHQALVEGHAAPEIRNIGDSFAVGRVLEATKAAYATATAL
ncbi:MAG TPA: FAD-dependent oxidoreductase, partial [Spirochaetia bacterium]|nr:FAD-dependent oxidoreductase [Spirochaetia bacterium]